MSRHTDLIDAVNDAKTEYDHTRADAFLQGWRDGLQHCGRRWDFMEADMHTEARFQGRPYCCGVLLDWKPVACGFGASGEPNGKRSTSAATASGHELPNGTGATAPSLPVANGGDARVASAGCPHGVGVPRG